MRSTSYKLLRIASVVVFILALFLYIRSQITIVPAQRMPVMNKEHQEIGETWLLYNTRMDLKIYGVFVVLSGVEVWAVFAMGKKS